MAGYILREDQPNIVLPAQQADRLIGRGDGDAALLYLCLLRADRGVTAQELQRKLKWSQLRLHAAETALQELGLIDRPPEKPLPEPAQERPVYTADDLTDLLTGDAGFRMLVPQTEEKLGKRLKTADLQILAGLYDDLGLPADVIYLLVCHCVARSEERYGPGRRPTLRQIEKEGYHWAQRGLFDQESASQYLRDWNVRRSAMSRYMQVLGLGDRRPVESEERYIADWMDKGFPPETVALAYDKTVFYKKELNWRYLNGILRRWHENGWHTEEEVRQSDSRKPSRREEKKDDSRMEKYMKW
ncbi:MAG: DnaD domain protein [Oscillospiraceae bacterium]|nr:DnaD domain protein [Oscillospiraceae bacterium]